MIKFCYFYNEQNLWPGKIQHKEGFTLPTTFDWVMFILVWIEVKVEKDVLLIKPKCFLSFLRKKLPLFTFAGRNDMSFKSFP